MQWNQQINLLSPQGRTIYIVASAYKNARQKIGAWVYLTPSKNSYLTRKGRVNSSQAFKESLGMFSSEISASTLSSHRDMPGLFCDAAEAITWSDYRLWITKDDIVDRHFVIL